MRDPSRIVEAKTLGASEPWPAEVGAVRAHGRALSLANLNPADRAMAAYAALTAGIVLARIHYVPGAAGLLALRAGLAVALLGCATGRVPAWLRWLREFYPVLLAPVFYEEIGHLNRAFTAGFFDARVIAWEQALFGGQPSITLRQQFPQVWLSEYLHLAYLSYYVLAPAVALLLYLQRRHRDLEIFLGTVSVTFFACMSAFIVFPVTGPFHRFTPPVPQTLGPVVPALVHWVLRGGSSLGSAFPSSHVAVSMSVLLLAARFSKPAFWVLLALVPALAVGAVYGGFHYAVDALAGLALALAVCWTLPPALERWASGPHR
ncbi:MAG TPA: phosphatase PAP2 family protein [Candidatus Saccharimonadales bacterium]|nr:phosphatase PAP2 family protein [Candidatus Saccharimonadales bacterium]